MPSKMPEVRETVPRACLDTCPHSSGENGIGFFIRNGPNGHFVSEVRKSPRAAWANAATKLRAREGDAPLFESNRSA